MFSGEDGVYSCAVPPCALMGRKSPAIHRLSVSAWRAYLQSFHTPATGKDPSDPLRPRKESEPGTWGHPPFSMNRISHHLRYFCYRNLRWQTNLSTARQGTASGEVPCRDLAGKASLPAPIRRRPNRPPPECRCLYTHAPASTYIRPQHLLTRTDKHFQARSCTAEVLCPHHHIVWKNALRYRSLSL